jgi:glycosyltransferase involved in cell wall biosynthesis
MMQSPKVSVIVPNYNHAPYLEQRLESILNQTFGDFELIILDDASTDNSHAILAKYHAKPRVRIAVNSRNSGSAFPQWNRGIGMARGEYVWIAESDDSADPRFLERLVPVLDQNPKLGLAYCQSLMMNKEGSPIGTSVGWTSDLDPVRWEADFANHGTDEIRNYLVFKNTIPNASAILLRREVVLETLPVDASFKLCGDWLHWGKVLFQSDLAYVAEPLNHWRVESSNSRPLPPGVLEWREGQRIIRHFAEKLGCSDGETSALLLRFADRCLGWLASSLGAA